VAIIWGNLLSNPIPNIINFINRHGGVRGERQFPPHGGVRGERQFPPPDILFQTLQQAD